MTSRVEGAILNGGSRQPETAPVDLLAGLLVEDLPLGAALGRGPRVATQDLADLGVDRLLNPGLVGQDPDDLGPHLVGRLEGGDALRPQQLFGHARGEVEDPLPAELHRTNPRSRASFSFVLLKSWR